MTTGTIQIIDGRWFVVFEQDLTVEPARLIKGFPLIWQTPREGQRVMLDRVHGWQYTNPVTGRTESLAVHDAAILIREEPIKPPAKLPRGKPRWVWMGGRFEARV